MANSRTNVDPEVFRQIRASAAPGMDADVIESILQGYFSGKRDSVRTYKFLSVEVQGLHGRFRGIAVDISRTGMLVRVTDPRFASPDEMDHLMPYTARVWYHFEKGMTARFSKGDVEAVAHVVRVTGYCGSGNSLILIGCRFKQPLDLTACEALDIEDDEDRPPGT